MSQLKHVTVIGGGIIGLACAYYLKQEGHSVRVIEKNAVGDSCATGNAGYVTPSHFIPLAAPGMIKKGLKWMLNPESPFYIRPRAEMSLVQWLWKFNQHCNSTHVNKVKQTLYELCSESKRLHFEIAAKIGNSYQLKQNGIYVITQSESLLNEEREIVNQAQALGLNASEVTVQELHRQFPDLQLETLGGIYFSEDAHLQPGELLASLYKDLVSSGVEFNQYVKVQRYKVKKDRVVALELERASDGATSIEEVDELVVAAGSWSPNLLQQLNIKVPIQAGKGYSITTNNPWNIDTPIILSDSAVAITPFEKKIRFGGTMEFAGLDQTINRRRVKGILNSVKRFIPHFDIDQVNQDIAWSGLRPCTPDGLPLVGRVPKLGNVCLAAGHAMLGLTLAPITGRLISELISEQPSEKLTDNRWMKYLAVGRFEY